MTIHLNRVNDFSLSQVKKINNFAFGNSGGGGTTLNATIIGNPTISDDFIVSGFNISNYLTFPLNDYNLPNNTTYWELTTKIKIGDGGLGISEQKIFDCATDQKNIRFGYNCDGAGYGFGCLFAGETGWVNGGQHKASNTYSTANVWMYCKLGFAENDYPFSQETYPNYYLRLSTDSTNWNRVIYARVATKVDFSMIERIGYYGSNNISYLSIDMKETYLKVNNQIVWQGVI